mmetsp:Transcript_23646/g.50169  ORF Transcript_23646/g.50169 Transcript_23646/m.50169 type:complete len:122 (-) Transcript_23646:9-374(-)
MVEDCTDNICQSHCFDVGFRIRGDKTTNQQCLNSNPGRSREDSFGAHIVGCVLVLGSRKSCTQRDGAHRHNHNFFDCSIKIQLSRKHFKVHDNILPKLYESPSFHVDRTCILNGIHNRFRV